MRIGKSIERVQEVDRDLLWGWVGRPMDWSEWPAVAQNQRELWEI